MADRPPTRWETDKATAKSLLHDRVTRRKMMTRTLVLLMVVFSLGWWVIDEWLAADVRRFILWWGACGAICVFMVLFALYDVTRVIREERERL